MLVERKDLRLESGFFRMNDEEAEGLVRASSPRDSTIANHSWLRLLIHLRRHCLKVTVLFFALVLVLSNFVINPPTDSSGSTVEIQSNTPSPTAKMVNVRHQVDHDEIVVKHDNGSKDSDFRERTNSTAAPTGDEDVLSSFPTFDSSVPSLRPTENLITLGPTVEDSDDEFSAPPTVDEYAIDGETDQKAQDIDESASAKEHSMFAQDATPNADWRTIVRNKAARCRTLLAQKSNMSQDAYDVLEADCGAGYDTKSVESDRPWTVVFYTDPEHQATKYSGCPKRGKGQCPLSPKCRLFLAQSKSSIKNADVVVVFQMEPHRILDVVRDSTTEKPYRALLWRESLWNGPHPPFQKDNFDFEIGTHHTAGFLNPQWFLAPSDLLSGRLYTKEPIPFIPLAQRPYFAISIISNCAASSLRDMYIKRLSTALGAERVHQYGACGTRELPPRPISNAAKLIAKYKFYLSFENTIQEGYVTEKLLEVISLPTLPVYHGDPIAPNITKSPSYIKTSDFSSPEDLAQYLRYLDANPEQYNKYHKWREQVNPFDDYYLTVMRERIAGPMEIEHYLKLDMQDHQNDELDFSFAQRRAQCCRLCDERLVRKAKQERSMLVPDSWDGEKINQKYFKGTLQPEETTVPHKRGFWGR